MTDHSKDWFDQAQRDLEQAKSSQKDAINYAGEILKFVRSEMARPKSG